MVPAVPVLVTGGVDTHADTHAAAALDHLGRVLGSESFPATAAGYEALTGWLASFGAIAAVGVEGTGCYGAGLSRHLSAAGVAVIDVNRPDRATRRSQGKSDPKDALAAARAVQSGTATATPKTRDDAVESLRVLRVDKDDLTKARAKLITRMKSLIVTAPEPIRAEVKGLPTPKLVKSLAAWESPIGKPAALHATDPHVATVHVLGNMARRYQDLTEQIDEVMAIIAALTAATTEGKTKKEIMRCLKRYIVRELYPHLLAAHA